MANETVKLGEYLAGLKYEMLPPEVIWEVKRRLADVIGIGVYTSRGAVTDKIVKYVSETAPVGTSTIWCSGVKLAPAYAAMANTCRIFYEELDDVHRTSHTHPASSTVPPALAVGETLGNSGKDIITAVVGGYESVARVGLSVSPSIFVDRTCIPCAILGSFGGATVSGILKGFGAQQHTGLLASASFLTPMMPVESYIKGTSIKEFSMGWCNLVGVTASEMMEYGFQGSPMALESPFGFCNNACAEYHLDRLTEKMGKGYAIMDSGIKPYAHCRQHHSAIDCMLELRRKYNLDSKAGEIEHVLVRTYNPAIRGKNKEFPTISAAKYSTPFALSVSVLFGDAWIGQYTQENLVNPDVINLAQKVDVVLDPELDALYDEKWPAIVEVEMKNGEKYSARHDLMKGEPEFPLSDEDLFKKYYSLATIAVSGERAQRIWDMIFELEKLDDINVLTKELF